RTELLKFGEIDLHLRARHQSLLPFEQTQFRVPVRERETQTFQVWMAGEDQRFDFRDLAAASCDSCCDPHPRVFDLGECPAIAVEFRFLAAQSLPAQYRDVNILRIEFQTAADAPG